MAQILGRLAEKGDLQCSIRTRRDGELYARALYCSGPDCGAQDRVHVTALTARAFVSRTTVATPTRASTNNAGWRNRRRVGRKTCVIAISYPRSPSST
jgi:hypothetical protein